MATRYWVGGTGAWSNTARWSDTSGGAGGFSVPVVGDTVYFNGSSGGGTVTFDTATIPAYDATGFTGTFTTSITYLIIDGPTLKFGAAASYSGMTYVYLKNTGGTMTLYCQGKALPGHVAVAGSVALGETGTFGYFRVDSIGDFSSNGFDINVFYADLRDASSLNFGTSTTMYLSGYADIKSDTSASTLNIVTTSSGNIELHLNSGTLGSLTFNNAGAQLTIWGPGTITTLTAGAIPNNITAFYITNVTNPNLGNIPRFIGGGGFSFGSNVVMSGTVVDALTVSGTSYLYIVNGTNLNNLAVGNIIFCNTSALALF